MTFAYFIFLKYLLKPYQNSLVAKESTTPESPLIKAATIITEVSLKNETLNPFFAKEASNCSREEALNLPWEDHIFRPY